MSVPWGHRITISIYLPGVESDAAAVAFEAAQSMTTPEEVEFVGVRVDAVQDEPKDQGGRAS